MAIIFKAVNYTYQPNTPFEQQALSDVSVEIPSGSYTALIGHTGSGKSTFLQHLNGLLRPTSGEIQIGKQVINAETKNKQLGELRKHVGVVFQFPEAQLFEETVIKDIAFAPKNFGKTEEEAEVIARRMAHQVGLDDDLLVKSPFELSGGQMRRVAIAGILAMEPEVLVLDEPTAGLDPKGRLEMMRMFKRLKDEQNLTVILVTHQMDDVANYADNVIVLEEGKMIANGTPSEIFSQPDWLVAHHLALPKAGEFTLELEQKTGIKFSTLPLTEFSLAQKIASLLHGGDVNHG
ncbi:energy-coupling factor ABC transporter ATP-binding protein [Liquorilactobacillus hordei]|uniref:Energy-coupling factor transporter ATP-binding protein EcfA2 n=1 Tax=Liquorilactobacillus hordei TaxID=468911 RepID=A0A3Q8CAL7_9LACO|nr:energy-coupling factor ABC transporter ATP-binding protein [Liquorilactobacillus hordei]AUJ30819.1 energy-coupling factor ABC transporter ATP-binding protein [Liquorilactobacillus hordei]